MNKLFKHLRTIHVHRKYVRRACFKMGLFYQGLVHDLSKYSLKELSIYKYYDGKMSPHQVCREQIGYSPSWIHHYHKNKHHYEYWLDDDADGKIIPIKMPYKYVVEAFCDMVGASMAYNPNNWQPKLVWNYWLAHCKGKDIRHEETSKLLEKLIWVLKTIGYDRFFKWYKKNKKELKADYEHESCS